MHVASADLLRGLPWDEIPVKASDPAAPRGEPPASVPATPQQSVVLFDHQMNPDSTAYLFHAVIEFSIAPEVDPLQTSLDALVKAQPLLRASFHSERGRWLMTTGAADPPRVVVVSTNEPVGSARLAMATGASRPFRLDGEALVRWTLARRQDGSAALIHTEHHLVHDGASFNLILDALQQVPSVRCPTYEEYAWRSAAVDVLESRRATARLMANTLPRDLGALAPLSVAPPESALTSHVRLPLPACVTRAAQATAHREGTTLFTVMFDAFAGAVRSLWQPNGPFALGVAVANRAPEFERTIGMFVTTVPIVLPAVPQRSRLADVSTAVRSAIDQAEFDLDEYVRISRRIGIDTRASLPSIAFSKHHKPSSTVRLAGHTGSLSVGVWNGSSKFDLNVVVIEAEDLEEFELVIEYRRTFVRDEDVWTLWTRFVAALGPEPEAAPAEPTVHPEGAETAVAVWDEGERFTYGELDMRAASLQSAVQCSGSQIIGILGVAGARAVAAEYIVHRAGHTFVPLTPLAPPGHISEMVRLAGCRYVIVTEPHERATELPPDVRVLQWDDLGDCDLSVTLPAKAAEIAYILFTSGTTGTPKGVRVKARSLARLATWGAHLQDLRPGVTASQVADLGFDASIWEIWPALSCGASLRVIRDAARKDPVELLRTLVRDDVQVAFAPTPVAELLMAANWPDCALRVLGAGGDRLHAFPRAQRFVAINLYGPTEATSVSTFSHVESDRRADPTIGRPVPYGYVRIIDDHGSEAGIGRVGELWVGGEGVAAGYLDLKREQDERFVPDPFSDDARTVYRTGDLARWRSDGEIEFLGRRDRQVKISGVRVELGAVESAVLGTGLVQSVAVDVSGPQGSQKLTIYVAAARDADAVATTVTDALPTYLRGSEIIVLNQLPVNRNGKVDLPALRDRKTSAPGDGRCDSAGSATALRERLAEHLPAGDWRTTWFDAGGTSLGAAQFASWAADEYGRRVPLGELLEAPDVAAYLGLDGSMARFQADGVTPLASAIQSIARLSDDEKLELAERLLHEGRTSRQR